MKQNTNVQELLRAKKLKVTPQRMLILDEIERSGHIGVEELHGRIKAIYPSISLATIYKNVNALAQEDVLRELMINGRKPLYEINMGDHVHFICDKCGEVMDYHMEVDSIAENLGEKLGLQVRSCEITLAGVCPACAKKSHS